MTVPSGQFPPLQVPGLAGAGSGSGAAGASTPPVAAVVPTPGDGTVPPSPVPEPKAGRRGKKNPADDPPAGEPAPTKARGETEILVAKATKFKNKLVATLSTCKSMARMILEDLEWKWANNEVNRGEMVTMLNTMDEKLNDGFSSSSCSCR